MPSPQEYWIKYLVCCQDFSNTDVNNVLDLTGFLRCEDAYISGVRDMALMDKPRLRVTDVKCRPWLRGQRILALARNDEVAQQARDTLSDTKLRPILEALLLAGLSDLDVALNAATLAQRRVSEELVRTYRHYFWNVGLLTLSEWRDYLDNYQGSHGKKLRTYYNKGAVFTLWKLGQRPTVTVDQAIETIFQESTLRFMELTAYPNGQDTALASKMWAENVFKASELLSRTDGAIKRSLDELSQVALRLGRREISSIDSLPKQLEESKEIVH